MCFCLFILLCLCEYIRDKQEKERVKLLQASRQVSLYCAIALTSVPKAVLLIRWPTSKIRSRADADSSHAQSPGCFIKEMGMAYRSQTQTGSVTKKP